MHAAAHAQAHTTDERTIERHNRKHTDAGYTRAFNKNGRKEQTHPTTTQQLLTEHQCVPMSERSADRGVVLLAWRIGQQQRVRRRARRRKEDIRRRKLIHTAQIAVPSSVRAFPSNVGSFWEFLNDRKECAFGVVWFDKWCSGFSPVRNFSPNYSTLYKTGNRYRNVATHKTYDP